MAIVSKKRKLKVPMALGSDVMEAQALPITSGPIPVCHWITVTPELATKWLDEININNRTIRQDYVDRMASDMAEGRWMGRNGEALRFDTKGRLVDGQHRCWACVVAKTPFETLAVYDVAPEAYSTIGIGAKKSLADFLGPMSGEKNVHNLAATLRIIFMWRTGNLGNLKDSRRLPTISQLEELLRDEPGIRDTVQRICSCSQLKKLFNLTFACLIHYAGTMSGHPATVEAFLERLGSGIGLTDTDPAYHLRKFLLAQRSPVPGHRRVGQQYILALAIKAWNATKNNEPMQRLVLKVNEDFPTL